MWTVDHAALDRIVIGAGILGTGGGGNPYLGKVHARTLLAAGARPVVVDPDEVPDDALVVSVGGMGSPTISIERIQRGDEPLVAMRALERHIGRSFTHLVPGEVGGSNSVRPIVVAAQSGLPVVDADGMGRAFPELQMETFTIYGVRPTPAALADPRGHVALFDGIEDAATLERYARAVTIQMGGSSGYAFPVMTGAEVKRTAIPRTLTLAQAVGEAVIAARADHRDPVGAVLDVCGGRRLFAGKIVDVERRLVGGFARGKLRLTGDGTSGQTELVIDLQNEYLIARTGAGDALAAVPDLICLVDADTAEPITTEVARYGLRVVVLGIPAAAMLRTPEALAVVGPAAFGYRDVPYVPLAGRYAGRSARVLQPTEIS
ncbi:MAG: DUF917 domain-containing protein [Chloroflexota bacterium]|nr:DUF917 domain-containing protein [Chloroflexota bacterium]